MNVSLQGIPHETKLSGLEFLKIKPETTLGKSVLNTSSYKQYSSQQIKESNDQTGFEESQQL